MRLRGGGLRGCVGASALHKGVTTMGKVVNYGGCCQGLFSMLDSPLGDLLRDAVWVLCASGFTITQRGV